jgi:predicted phage terminase large subunit-like protein
MDDRLALLQVLLRQDLGAFTERVFRYLHPGTPFVDNWHLAHIAWQLGRVASGEINRLIINVPPRSLKSIQVSVAFSAWYLGRNPAAKIMCVSYAEELARELSTNTRNVITSPWFEELFPEFQLAQQRNMQLTTTEGGYRFAAGLGGSVLGRGADLIIVDDPIKATDALSQAERRRVNEFYDNTLITRLNNKRSGAIVIIMQRLHEDDLAGHVLDRDDWEVVAIPAIATETEKFRIGPGRFDIYQRKLDEVLYPTREPREILDRIRRTQGSLTFSAQYQQAPLPPGGNIVRREWIKHYDQRPETFDLLVASWDTASTIGDNSDFSVGAIWGAKGLDYYLLDLVRGRYEFYDLRLRVTELSKRWGVDATVIEETELGRALHQDLRRTAELRTILRKPLVDKEARMLAQSARFEAGQVHVPKEAPWLAQWMTELLAFPTGRNDDQVDSTSQALQYLTRRSMAAYVDAQSKPRPRLKRPQPMIRPPGYQR